MDFSHVHTWKDEREIDMMEWSGCKRQLFAIFLPVIPIPGRTISRSVVNAAYSTINYTLLINKIEQSKPSFRWCIRSSTALWVNCELVIM